MNSYETISDSIMHYGLKAIHTNIYVLKLAYAMRKKPFALFRFSKKRGVEYSLVSKKFSLMHVGNYFINVMSQFLNFLKVKTTK